MLTPSPSQTWRMALTPPLGPDRIPTIRVGELLGATNRQFQFNLNRPSTLQFNINLESPHAMDIMGYPDGLIVLYQGSTVRMTAEIASLEVVGEEDGTNSIGVVAVETMWPRFQKVLVGQSSAGLKGPTSATDQGTWIVTTVLGNINGDAGLGVYKHTGIAQGTVVASGNITGGVWRYTPFMEIIQELAASTNGFDFWQVPADPTAGTVGTAKAGDLWIAPLKGTTKTSVVLEYGTPLPNASSYRVVYDTTDMINRAIGLPPSFPDSGGLAVVSSFGSARANVVGVREEVIPMEMKTTSLRQALVDNHKIVRQNPRSIFEIQPMPDVGNRRVPTPLVDYVPGDTIRGRVYVHGNDLLDALVRVYGITVEPTDEGTDNVTVSLVNEA